MIGYWNSYLGCTSMCIDMSSRALEYNIGEERNAPCCWDENVCLDILEE